MKCQNEKCQIFLSCLYLFDYELSNDWVDVCMSNVSQTCFEKQARVGRRIRSFEAHRGSLADFAVQSFV
jgi:hypothetical protein